MQKGIEMNPSHRTSFRVLYGDTDKMGFAYYGNYMRWFEIGRSQLFRSWGFSYKSIEEKGVFLPVSEAFCKYVTPVKYDDQLIVETRFDPSVKAGIKFDYRIFSMEKEVLCASGYTLHACMNPEGRVIRPPRFLSQLLREHTGSPSDKKEGS